MGWLRARWLALDRRRRAIVAGLLVLVVAGVAAFGFLAYDAVRPTSVELNVREGQREIPLDQRLVFTASRPMTLTALRSALRIDPPVEGTLTGGSPGRRFTWTPSEPWADLTAYTVRLLATVDTGGRTVSAQAWHFTTTLVPRVLALVTASGTSVSDGAEIPVGTQLRLVFNTAIETATVGLLANGGQLALNWAADGRSAGLDVQPLRIGRVTFTLRPDGRDRTGRSLAGWRLEASIVYAVGMPTVPLRVPALVQVPNDPAARDQSGLQAASIVYEYLTEGGITRFTGIFTNAPEEIGPVRSGRLISFALTSHYRGVLFASGLSAGSDARLRADPVPHVFDSPDVYHRTTSRFPPNNLVAAGAAVQRATDRSGLESFTLPAGTVPLTSGADGATVSVPEHRSIYTFDPGTATYTKRADGRPLGDAATGQPLHIRLVILMHTTASRTDYVEDVNGQPGLDFDMRSGGRADFLFNGLLATGRWSAPDPNGPFRFVLDSGATISPPPLTWVDVMS